MRLLRLQIENFGKLQNYSLDFQDGLNTLHAPNGWGKSTLAVFIKAMLYGLPATSKRALDENERKKYTPWQGGAFGGSLEFSCARGEFRVERTFGAKESADTFALYDLQTNRPSQAFSRDLGEELFGIDADGFERSTYLSQRALFEKSENSTISARLNNLLDDVDDIGSYDEAIALLEKRRKFYTMTGNRGAIAELEREIFERETELEQLHRVELAVKEHQAELAECQAQMQALQNELTDTRKALKQAGLGRERAALLERKNTEQADLAARNREKQAIEARFDGAVPSEEEYQKAHRLYDAIREARAKANAVPTQISEHEELRVLRDKYVNGTPDENTLRAMQESNNRLRELRARRDLLLQTQETSPRDPSFPNGIPSSEQINSAFETLRGYEQAQKESEDLRRQLDGIGKGAATTLPLLSLVLLAALEILLGFAATVLSPILWILFAVLLIPAAILCVVFLQRKKAQKDQKLKTELALREADAKHLHAEKKLQEFLSRNGADTSQDPARALSELNALAAQHRAAFRQRRRVDEELQTVQTHIEENAAALQMQLSAYLTVQAKVDYQSEVDRLGKDTETLVRLEAAESKRQTDRTEAERVRDELQAQLLPFLRRYDPTGTMRAGECMSAIGQACSEYRFLMQTIKEREDALKAFLAEKFPPNETELPVQDYGMLTQKEANMQLQAIALQDRQTELRHRLERLLSDADRIPELREELTRKKEQLEEYKRNSKTVADTAKFLEEAKVALSTRYLDGMQKSFCRFLSLVSDSGSLDPMLDTSFEVRLRDGGQTRSLDSFSRGWRDLIRFCLRLSLADALYPEDEKPFLLLDDPFVNLDEAHLDAARRLLDGLSSDYQIVYMICHEDRK